MVFACEAILGFNRCDLARGKDKDDYVITWLSDSATWCGAAMPFVADLHVSPGLFIGNLRRIT